MSEKISILGAFRELFNYLFSTKDIQKINKDEKCPSCHGKMEVYKAMVVEDFNIKIYHCRKCSFFREIKINTETKKKYECLNYYNTFFSGNSLYCLIQKSNIAHTALNQLFEINDTIYFRMLYVINENSIFDFIYININDYNKNSNSIKGFLYSNNIVGEIVLNKVDLSLYLMNPYLANLPYKSFSHISFLDKDLSIKLVFPVRYQYIISEKKEYTVHEISFIKDMPFLMMGIKIDLTVITLNKDSQNMSLKQVLNIINFKNIFFNNDVSIINDFYIKLFKVTKLEIHSVTAYRPDEGLKREIYDGIKYTVNHI